ncbi:hypothetical protein [Streptomyces atroolivaceus]|uniref:hypothetical protein n=1 Tax=Streptomyces atroolivaceus TaxID=66869 RepID=UPI00342BFF48
MWTEPIRSLPPAAKICVLGGVGGSVPKLRLYVSRIAQIPSVRADSAAENGTECRSRTVPSAVSTSRKSVRARASGPETATRTLRSSAATSIRVPPLADGAGTLHRADPSAAQHSTATCMRVASTRPSSSPATARTPPCAS